METPDEPEFRVVWEELGIESSAFSSWSVDTGYMTSADEFRLEMPRPKGVSLADLALQPVTLKLDDAQLLLGRVEHISSGARPGHISLAGRDQMAELLENNIDPFCVVREGDTLGSVVLQVCGPCGITSVLDDGGFQLRQLRTAGKAKGRKRNKKSVQIQAQELKPEPGLGVYEYVSRILRRYGCTLQPGTARNEVLIAAPEYDQEPSGFVRYSADRGGSKHVAGATADRDYSQFLTYVLSTGMGGKEGEAREVIRTSFDWVEHGNAAGGAGYGFNWVKHKSSTREAQTRAGTDTAAASAMWSEELANTVAARSYPGRRKPGEGGELDPGDIYRFVYLRDQTARDQGMLVKAVSRMVSERLRRTLAYQVTLNGCRDPETDILYAPDTIVDVQDDVNEVAEPLWVARRSFHADVHGGVRTHLECWRPGSFVIG